MYKEYFIYNVDTTLTGGAGTVFTDSILNITSDADFEAKKFIHQATDNRVYTKVFDESKSRYLFKGSPDIRMLSGQALASETNAGFLAHTLADPYVFLRNSRVKFQLSDYSGAGNTVRLAMHGVKNKEGQVPIEITPKRQTIPFVYETAAPVTLAAALNAQSTGVIQIDNDADVLVTRITGIATGAGLVTIEEPGNTGERFWQNIPTHVFNLVGNAQFPNILPAPRFVRRNSLIIITFSNLTAALNSLTLQLHGRKVF